MSEVQFGETVQAEQQWREELEAKFPELRAWPGKDVMSIYKKLNEARAKFHELKLAKTGRNTFANYNYFELGDFLIPGLQVMREVGLCPLPVTFDKDGMARMTIVDIDKPEDRIVFESPMGSAALKGCHEVQNIGAVETYQRRYLWVAALEIVEHDAIDATTGKAAPEKRATGPSSAVAASFKSSATMGVFETLSPDRQALVMSIAEYVIERYSADDIVAAYAEANTLIDDERVALAGKLPSHVKTALRKYGESLKTSTKEELAA